ncbi:HEAT repeat domain-containing protein [Paenibacillus mendelii]|uniref:HEAT repeat domain-containing protein n=1 Tax=Paenibacillus mendelii TaxID=206163 RepID=A0ABV6J419_9BACL|nr:HEAT repeat domain-containing protein [Paenibacillus mendelii]MCQ6562055.1 HEAT repeat domain-containing protein [Paenibacillus mendelii]
MNQQSPLLLTDEQLRTFITNGFLILQTDFSDSFHEQLMAQLNQVYENEGNPGNNLLPRIRELQKVFDHPVITGALTSVLGENYMLHAHRHGHYNASPVAGGWHKDSYWGYGRMRNHHPWWAMIMYFPQDTPVELGPTGVMPGTQNYETRTFAKDDIADEAVASGSAGTFALIHYDIWHRSTPNVLGKHRYMLKFEFMRTQAPESPSWNNQETAWRKPASYSTPFGEHDVLWEETWNWLSGRMGSMAGTKPASAEQVSSLVQGLGDASEPVALNAAYDLAAAGAPGVEALLQALRHENKAISRLAAYGLSISGEAAVPGLIAALNDARPETVVHAVFALGELRDLAASAVPALNGLLDNGTAVAVRRAVVEALGIIGTPIDEVTAGLIRCLQDEDVQVRFMAGLSLSRLGSAAKAAVPQLIQSLDDENRYVRAHSLEALRYIGTEEAKEALIEDLFRSRWCFTTTKENAFYP